MKPIRWIIALIVAVVALCAIYFPWHSTTIPKWKKVFGKQKVTLCSLRFLRIYGTSSAAVPNGENRNRETEGCVKTHPSLLERRTA